MKSLYLRVLGDFVDHRATGVALLAAGCRSLRRKWWNPKGDRPDRMKTAREIRRIELEAAVRHAAQSANASRAFLAFQILFWILAINDEVSFFLVGELVRFICIPAFAITVYLAIRAGQQRRRMTRQYLELREMALDNAKLAERLIQ